MMDEESKDAKTLSLAVALEADMMIKYGPLLSEASLREALGFRSVHAIRKALLRRMVPVPLFRIPHRRGWFALTKEVAYWMATVRCQTDPLPIFNELIQTKKEVKEDNHET